MMREFVVTLRVITDMGHPGKWDWADLVQSEVDESVTLIDVVEE